jgi:putative heme iron utilization protein
MKKDELEREVNRLIASQEIAMLSTYAEESRDSDIKEYSAAGFPFGSIVRYIVGQSDEYAGMPIVMLSRIAEHSKHICQNNNVSLLVSDQETHSDVQQTARLTILGSMIKLDADNPALQHDRELYFNKFPETRNYFQLLDFDFYYLHIEKKRYVAGFGRAHWLKTL